MRLTRPQCHLLMGKINTMEQKFLNLVLEVLEIEDRELHLSDKFREFDEWDSLANLSLIAMLDEEFGLVIDTYEFRKMTTLQEIFNALPKHD
jgi:acyl carrier protein